MYHNTKPMTPIMTAMRLFREINSLQCHKCIEATIKLSLAVVVLLESVNNFFKDLKQKRRWQGCQDESRIRVTAEARAGKEKNETQLDIASNKPCSTVKGGSDESNMRRRNMV
ncbi:hypothetical protein VNO78_07471 [Psophocarpus tetragonolobus]|uniref:Uncharacterized protein n=1 Tax=Psophocarpus tetragonolobus TaxID=3891 RepID=A0AAN9XSS6_PSOTE